MPKFPVDRRDGIARARTESDEPAASDDPTAHLDAIETRAHDALADLHQSHLGDLDRPGAAISVQEGPR